MSFTTTAQATQCDKFDIDGDSSAEVERSISDMIVDEISQTKWIQRIRPKNAFFRRVMDFHIYRLKNCTEHYDSSVLEQLAKWIEPVEKNMKDKMFDPRDPITILAFLSAFRTSCDKNGISEGVAKWLFQVYMKEPAKSDLHRYMPSPLAANENGQCKLWTYAHVVTYLLLRYATDDVMHRAVSDVLQLGRSKQEGLSQNMDAMRRQTARFGELYDRHETLAVFSRRLHDSVKKTVRKHWVDNGRLDVLLLAKFTNAVYTTAAKPALRAGEGGVGWTCDEADGGRKGRRGDWSILDNFHRLFDLLDELSGLSHIEVMTPTALMDHGDVCRVCLAYKTHVTSRCPYIKHKEDFIRERNANFARQARLVFAWLFESSKFASEPQWEDIFLVTRK